MTLSCPECRTRFRPKRVDQRYCSAKCNTSAGKRELVRCRRLYRCLYHWRLRARGYKNLAADLRFICQEIGSWIREDRLSQRLPPPPHDHMADRGHQRKQGTVWLDGTKPLRDVGDPVATDRRAA